MKNKIAFNFFIIMFSVSVNAGVVGHWGLDDAAGNIAIDLESPGYDGTLINFPADDSQWVTGHDGAGALDFDGVNDRVEISGANAAAGFDVTSDFTWSAWIKTGDVSNGIRKAIINYSLPGAIHAAGNKILTLQPNGSINLLAFGVLPADGYSSAVTVNDNQWHHVAVTVEHNTNSSKDTIKVYVDGDLNNGYTAEFDLTTGNESSVHVIIMGNNIKAGKWAAFSGHLDEVRIYDHTLSDSEIAALAYVTPQLTQASDPSPTDGKADVEMDIVLNWSSYNFAVSHDVYLSTSYAEVLNADTTSAAFFRNQTENYFMPGSFFLLQPLTTYYWRIDEVNTDLPDSPLKGEIWSFTTADNSLDDGFIVENFDNYTDDASLLSVWDNGNTNGSGSAVTLALPNTWMQMDYNGASYSTRYYGIPQNWGGILEFLSLNFKGKSSNDAASLYLEISDGANTATITHSNPAAIQHDQWQRWDMALSEIADLGVDLLNVMSVKIGVASGIGTVFIDDITLHAKRCLAEYTSSVDLDLDCDVDMQDLFLLVDNWLLEDYQVEAISPNDSNLQAYYKLDEVSGLTANDETGNNFHAQIDAVSDGEIWQSTGGYNGGCLQVDGQFHLILPADVFTGLNDQYTLCLWVHDAVSEFASDESAYMDYEAGLSPFKDNYWDRTSRALDKSDFYADSWHHYAVVKDVMAQTIQVYLDGELISQNTSAAELVDSSNADVTYIGSSEAGTTSDCIILLDEVRVYNYALSHSEIAYLSVGYGGQVVQPIQPVFTEFDPVENGRIDLDDFALFGSNWLGNTNWPAE